MRGTSSERMGESIRSCARLKSCPGLLTVASMERPIEVDLPHRLGREEARRRIANNVHKLEEHIPGGAQVATGWAGDRLNLDITAMGQSVSASIDVEESKVRLRVMLPGMLAMFARPIEAMLSAKGGLLLEDRSKKD